MKEKKYRIAGGPSSHMFLGIMVANVRKKAGKAGKQASRQADRQTDRGAEKKRNKREKKRKEDGGRRG